MQSINHILVPLPHRVPKKSESKYPEKIGTSHWIVSCVMHKPCQKKRENGHGTLPTQAFAQCQFQHRNGLNLRRKAIYDPMSSSTIQNHHHATFPKCIIYQRHMHQSQEENRRTNSLHICCNHMQLNELLAMTHIIRWFWRMGGPMSKCQLSVAIVHTCNLTYSKPDMKLFMASLTSSLTMLLSNHSTPKPAATFATRTNLELMRAMTVNFL